MDMEAETTEAAVIAKGKRTKRQRPNSPILFTITATAAHNYPRSPTFVSSSEESTTTEEVDTARCLLLLSRGPTNRYSNNNNRRNEAATATTSYGGACMYTCKTCGRSFRSFQALGGHRSSHGKPKNEKKSATFSDEEDFPSPNSLSLQLSSVSTSTYSPTLRSPRIHECSYCGAEFSSGQALGGHMRKHRGAGPIGQSSNIPDETAIDELESDQRKKPRIWLSLDLNLPAPEDERERTCPPLIKRHD